MRHTFLKVVNINEKEDWTNHSTLRNSTEDRSNKGVNPIDSHNLCSLCEETFYTKVDFTTDAVCPDLLGLGMHYGWKF